MEQNDRRPAKQSVKQPSKHRSQTQSEARSKAAYAAKARGGDSRVRLNKAIADSGLASRRHADRLIEEGSVTVNGKKVYELGIKVDPRQDKILVGGKPLKSVQAPVYAILNKPKGVLTTMEDPEGRPTIAQYLEKLPVRLFPVGRLDWDSEGLILLTNNGDYAQKIMHPSSEVTKTYLVKVDGQPRPEQLQKLKNGVPIIGGRVSAKHISRIERGKEQYAWLKIVITEGKNRQIRLMFEKIGFDVLKLQRIAIGRLRLPSIDRGELVFLNEVMAQKVFQADEAGTEEARVKTAKQPSLKRLAPKKPGASKSANGRRGSARSEARARYKSKS